jgi:hypothetical protein
MSGKRMPDFVFGKNQLFIDPELSRTMPGAGATYGGIDAALISREAYEILREHCREDRKKLLAYLKAITEFEIHHSDDKERHLHRTPIEQEILDLWLNDPRFK